MNTFKRKALFTAVVAGFGAAAGTAEAVYLSPNRTGQALVYPYYTVQSSAGNAYNTYISVVNTTTFAKVVKVRFLEGKTSAEVLDFNLFLSANDVWTAAIVPTSDGAKIITGDNSCTAPTIPFPGGQAFRNFQYLSEPAALGTTLDRTREGYIELIEMASLPDGGALSDAVTHDATGVPADCSVVQVADYAAFAIGVDFDVPVGGLMGTGTLISPNTGLDAGYKADALEAFSDTPNLRGPGDIRPNLTEPSPTSSVVFNSGYDPALLPVGNMNLTVFRLDYDATTGSHASPGAQATASVFMHETIMNEYVLDSGTASLTDWVVTQPLKRYFVDEVTAAPPYTEVQTDDGACEPVSFTYFNREERGQTAGGIDFSPQPPGPSAGVLCWESTVMSIVNGADHMPTDDTTSAVLFSKNTVEVGVSDFENGWARLTFIGDNADPAAAIPVGLTSLASSQWAPIAPGPAGFAAPTAGAVTLFGLPSTGFMIRTFTRNNIQCNAGACQGNYSAIFNHSYRSLNILN